MDSPVIYLDHAAATPVADFVLAAMQPYMSTSFYHPSSPYAPAIAARRDYEAAKARLAGVIGAKPSDVIMTAGATESINLMFGSVTGHVVTSAIEHASVLEAARRHDHTLVRPNEKGVIVTVDVQKALRPDTQLVSIALANNELGTIQSLHDISLVIETERARRREAGESTPLWLHTDASQGAGYLDLHVSRLGVDALTLNAGKVYGPKQVGLLWAAPYVQLRPLLVGGGQEAGLRSGTENIAGAVGFAAALVAADASRKAETQRVGALRDNLQSVLLQAFPDAVISGNQKKRLPNYLHISFPGLDAERLLFMLESRGVLVATGSACAANKGTRSHVLTAIGMPPQVADGSLRLTLGKLSTIENIQQAAGIIFETIANEKRRVGK